METFIIVENTFENKLIVEYTSHFIQNATVENTMSIFSLQDISKDFIKNTALTKRVVVLLHSHFPEDELLSIIPDNLENEMEMIVRDTHINTVELPINCIISSWYYYFSELFQLDVLDKNLLKTLTTQVEDVSVRYVKRYCKSLIRYHGDMFREHVENLSNAIAYNRGKNEINEIQYSDDKAVYKCIDGEHYAILVSDEIENAYKILNDTSHVGVLLCNISLSTKKILITCILRNGSVSLLNTFTENKIKIMKYTSNTITLMMEWSSLVNIMKTTKEYQWKGIKTM